MASGCLGVGNPASASGHASVVEWATHVFASGQKLPSSTRRKNAKADRLYASNPNLFHRMGGLRKGNDGPQRFWLRLLGTGNRFCYGFRFQRRQHNGNLTFPRKLGGA